MIRNSTKYFVRFHNEKKMESSERIICEALPGDIYTLTIREVLSVEAGMYTVTAGNEVGKMRASARLKVTRKSSSSVDHQLTCWSE